MAKFLTQNAKFGAFVFGVVVIVACAYIVHTKISWQLKLTRTIEVFVTQLSILCRFGLVICRASQTKWFRMQKITTPATESFILNETRWNLNQCASHELFTSFYRYKYTIWGYVALVFSRSTQLSPHLSCHRSAHWRLNLTWNRFDLVTLFFQSPHAPLQLRWFHGICDILPAWNLFLFCLQCLPKQMKYSSRIVFLFYSISSDETEISMTSFRMDTWASRACRAWRHHARGGGNEVESAFYCKINIGTKKPNRWAHLYDWK